MKNMFVVILRYLVSLDQIEPYRPQHIEFLDTYFAQGVFIASGGQVPRTGGMILAKGSSRLEIEAIVKQDPFFLEGLAEYQIFECAVTKKIPAFADILSYTDP